MRWLDWLLKTKKRADNHPEFPAPGQKYVVSESMVTITTHVREIGDRPVRLGGHASPRPKSLCNMEVWWDTKLPISTVRCHKCVIVLAKKIRDEGGV